MRSIDLKTVTVETVTGTLIIDYRRQFIGMLEFVPEGVTVNELAALVAVSHKLSRASNTVTLDENEWITLKRRIEATKFSIVNQEIIDMIQTVTEAPEM